MMREATTFHNIIYDYQYHFYWNVWSIISIIKFGMKWLTHSQILKLWISNFIPHLTVMQLQIHARINVGKGDSMTLKKQLRTHDPHNHFPGYKILMRIWLTKCSDVNMVNGFAIYIGQWQTALETLPQNTLSKINKQSTKSFAFDWNNTRLCLSTQTVGGRASLIVGAGRCDPRMEFGFEFGSIACHFGPI